MTLQRDYSVTELMSTNAPGSVILVRLYVGLIFIIEGMLKYARPEQLICRHRLSIGRGKPPRF